MHRENNHLFSEYGVTPVHLRTLVFIHLQNKSGQRVCQKDVESHLNLRPSSVSSLVSNLEDNGFLCRTVDGDNARKKYIELTEKGKTVCKKEKLMMDECDGIIQSALTEEEQELFSKLLQKIITKIEGGKS